MSTGFLLCAPPPRPGMGSTYTQEPSLGAMRLSLTLNITPSGPTATGFMVLASGPFLPESWELAFRHLESSHMLSSFGLKCSKSAYYGL